MARRKNALTQFIENRTARKQRWTTISDPTARATPSIDDESIWDGSYWGDMSAISLLHPQGQVDAFKSYPYICINRNAKAVARQTLRLYRTKGTTIRNVKAVRPITDAQKKWLKTNNGLDAYLTKSSDIEEITEHPFLKTMRTVSQYHNQADMWMLTESFMGVTGNCFWYPVLNVLGEPYKIFFLETQRVRVILGENMENLVLAFVYRTSMTDRPFSPDEVVHHKTPNLAHPAIGLSPMLALADSVLINEEMYTYERAQFGNMGRVDAVLEMDPEYPLNKEEYERMKKEWRQNYGGAHKAGQTAILEGGLTYKAISLNPRDLGHIEGRKLTREEIAAGFGIPYSLLSPEKSNRSTGEVAYKEYMRDTIDPKLKVYEQKINEQLLPMYKDGENLFVAFDNCIPEDREYALKELNAYLATAYSSVNIEREKRGEDPVDWGDIPIIPANMAPLGSSTPEQAAAAAQAPKEIDYDLLAEKVADMVLLRAEDQ